LGRRAQARGYQTQICRYLGWHMPVVRRLALDIQIATPLKFGSVSVSIPGQPGQILYIEKHLLASIDVIEASPKYHHQTSGIVPGESSRFLCCLPASLSNRGARCDLGECRLGHDKRGRAVTVMTGRPVAKGKLRWATCFGRDLWQVCRMRWLLASGVG
jgi:hypothetical protein